MKKFKRVIAVLLLILVSAVVGYFVFTGSRLCGDEILTKETQYE